ncbi:methyltransferase domain-containing protein [Calidifontibacter terrae]
MDSTLPDLLLTCAVGLEELLRGDLQPYAAATRVTGEGLLAAHSADLVAVRANPMVDRIAVPWDPAQRPAVDLLTQILGSAALTFRVHASDAAERARLIERVVDNTGWRNEPGNWQLNLVPGAERIELGPLSWAARFGTMQRLPATTPPAVAAGALRLAKLRDGMNLVDVCGGVGTIPIVDALTRDGRGLVVDLNPESIQLAQRNIESFGQQSRVSAEVGDATDIDLATGSVDRVVSDVPFGKRIGSNEANDSLYPALVAELGRILADDGRAVLITDDKRRFAECVRRDRQLKVVKETGLRYNGVTPTAFTLARVRGRRS